MFKSRKAYSNQDVLSSPQGPYVRRSRLGIFAKLLMLLLLGAVVLVVGAMFLSDTSGTSGHSRGSGDAVTVPIPIPPRNGGERLGE